jgi:predicted permease
VSGFLQFIGALVVGGFLFIVAAVLIIAFLTKRFFRKTMEQVQGAGMGDTSSQGESEVIIVESYTPGPVVTPLLTEEIIIEAEPATVDTIEVEAKQD